MRDKCRLEKFIALFLVLAVLALPPGLPADAAEAVPNGTETAGQVEIRVEGSVEQLDREAILNRLNEIREEACREGVPNPVNGEPMGPEDYVPLEWSAELENIAILRAAESTILQDHVRPDGSDCFTAAPDGVPYTMETLAWGFGSAEAAVEGWYSEKTAYVDIIKHLFPDEVIVSTWINTRYDYVFCTQDLLPHIKNAEIIKDEYTTPVKDEKISSFAHPSDHLPIIVDPSHAAGIRWMIEPLSKAAVAIGADGLIIEVHNNPDKALSDGAQSVTPDMFDTIIEDIKPIATAIGRSL